MDLENVKNYALIGLTAYFGLSMMWNVAKAFSRNVSHDHIAQIYLHGSIQGYNPGVSLYSGKGFSPESVQRIVDSAIENGAKGIIFNINCPGGEVVASAELADYINDIEIPTCALIKSVAASGAYWATSACDYSVSHELSIVGSIGVVQQRFDLSGLFERIGIKDDSIYSGEFKTTGSPFRSLRDDERAMLQERSDQAYDIFISGVAENLDHDQDYIREHAEGKVYFGADAVTLKLIDEVGGKKQAVAYMKDKLGIEEIMDYTVGNSQNLISKIFGASAFSFGSNVIQGMKSELHQRY